MVKALQNPMTLREAAAALDQRRLVPAERDAVPAPQLVVPDELDGCSSIEPTTIKRAVRLSAP